VLLRDALLNMPGVREDLARAKRIQIIAARPDEPTLPLEICYDGTAPADGATMCPQWEEALSSGGCQPACPLDRSTVVCPVAFWGTSRIIERHAYSKVDAKELGSNDYALQSEPVGRRTRLSLAPGSICAAAAAARAVDAAAVSELFTKAGTIAKPSGEVTDWGAWREAITGNPSLLMLLAHTDQKDGIRTLVIGSKNAAFISSIDASFVGKAAGHGPITLLLGCSTAVAELAFQSFVARFRLAGAAIVIGTLCEILGQHAAPIASQILTELESANATRDGIPLGDLMTDLRRQLLSRGYPIVMAVAAYGDADWLI
jgi:energy-converting hydrogenase Eha subunit C